MSEVSTRERLWHWFDFAPVSVNLLVRFVAADQILKAGTVGDEGAVS
jgi:hypothetical protein